MIAQAVFLHGGYQQIRYAYPGGAKAEDRDPLFLERNARRVDGRQYGRGGDGRRPLNIVVECTELVAIAFQQACCIGAGEILPLQQYVGPTALHCRNKGFDKVIIFLTTHALVRPADIKRIVQKIFVVRAYVQQHWQAMFRVDSGKSSVQCHLPDWYSHATGTLVAQSKDSFSVTDDD